MTMDSNESTSAKLVDNELSRFGARLKTILGKGRIPRAEKEAKAKEAMAAVDDLLSAIDKDLEGISTDS